MIVNSGRVIGRFNRDGSEGIFFVNFYANVHRNLIILHIAILYWILMSQ